MEGHRTNQRDGNKKIIEKTGQHSTYLIVIKKFDIIYYEPTTTRRMFRDKKYF